MKKYKLILSMILFILIFITGCGKEEYSASEEIQEDVLMVTPESARMAPYYPKAESFAGGDGTEENPYLIENAGQLALLAHIFSIEGRDYYYKYKDAYFKQVADIVINDPVEVGTWDTKAPTYNWLPIGDYYDFDCKYDGNGCTIRGLYLYEVNLENKSSGLFGGVYDAEIKNIILEDSYIYSNKDIGGIVGVAKDSSVENCYVNIAIDGSNGGDFSNVGGIVGSAYDCTLNDCIFEGDIKAKSHGGGIAGCFSGMATTCINLGYVECLDEISAYVGGIFGRIRSGIEGTQIQNCQNKGFIVAKGNCSLGGIAGIVAVNQASDLVDHKWVYYQGKIALKNCENAGSILGGATDGTASIGGIIGLCFGTEYAENVEICSVESCANKGDVTANGYTGGIVGQSTMFHCPLVLTDCVNEAKIISAGYAGGILGYCLSNTEEKKISYCMNYGDVEGMYAGGILGAYFGFNLGVKEDGKTYISNCYNSGRVNGNHIGGIVGTGMDITETVYIDACINEGNIIGGISGRVGGILGADALASVVKMDGCTFKITDCVNLGNVSLGNGNWPFNSNIQFAEVVEDVDSAEGMILLLGGSCMGGIAGSVNQSIIQNCVNLGLLSANDNTGFIKDHADVEKMQKEGYEKHSVFAGGICGTYLFMEESDTLDSTGIYNCIYESTAPIAFSNLGFFAGEESVKDVQALDIKKAQKAAEELMKWH